ncbi:acyltransferase [Salmonella enterica]|uniref:acyltransferase n=1 Tax=Salmonella enterica TaxID=28901 RepID=UPI0009A9526D|nr:acyltransferase [Salmonella enterica]
MRNVSADLLRIICCMLVIGIHSTPNYALMVETNQSAMIIYQSMVLKAIVAIGLPIFFMMSGYFLLNKPSNNLLSDYRKRFVTLLVPFFIYAFINYYFLHKEMFYNEGVSGFFRLLCESQIAIATHLWFVYVLLGIYIVSPALKVITNAIPKEKSIYAIIIIALICSWPQYEYQLPKIFTWYKSVIPLPRIDLWVGYFVIGGLLAKADIRRPLALKLFYCSVAIQILFTWLSVNKYGFDTKPFDFSLSMFFVACMLTIVVTGIKIQSESLLGRLILWIAPYTYGIYLIHMLILIWITAYFSVPTVTEWVTLKALVYIPTVFVLSLALAFILDNLVVNRIVNALK